MDLSFLPSVNATLNAVATGLLYFGRRKILVGQVQQHRRLMISAFVTSSLFLVLYVIHKASRHFHNTTFNMHGPPKVAYLTILFSHLTLAMAVPPMAIALIVFGLRGRIDRHRRLARIAWPIWMYVSVTGVVIYVLLYHLNPPAA
jgi:uncharacterized membrane protein YozB (DUF420 family)